MKQTVMSANYSGGQKVKVMKTGVETRITWTSFVQQGDKLVPVYDCLVPSGKLTKDKEIIKHPKRFHENELVAT